MHSSGNNILIKKMDIKKGLDMLAVSRLCSGFSLLSVARYWYLYVTICSVSVEIELESSLF